MSSIKKTCSNCEKLDVHNYGDRECPFVSFNGITGRYVQVLPLGRKWDTTEDGCTKWEEKDTTGASKGVVQTSITTEIVPPQTTRMRNTDIVVGAVKVRNV